MAVNNGINLPEFDRSDQFSISLYNLLTISNRHLMRIQDLIRPSNGAKVLTLNSPTENLYKMCGSVRRIFMLIKAMELKDLILNPKKAFNY